MVISERQAEGEPSIRFDDFYAERWPYAFRLAALMTHDAEAGAERQLMSCPLEHGIDP